MLKLVPNVWAVTLVRAQLSPGLELAPVRLRVNAPSKVALPVPAIVLLVPEAPIVNSQSLVVSQSRLLPFATTSPVMVLVPVSVMLLPEVRLRSPAPERVALRT